MVKIGAYFYITKIISIQVFLGVGCTLATAGPVLYLFLAFPYIVSFLITVTFPSQARADLEQVMLQTDHQ